jgi:hypothetical protein
VSVAAKLFFRKICFKAFFLFGRVIYPSEKENASNGLKIALKKAARFRTPPKNFFLSVVERLPTSFAQRCKDTEIFITTSTTIANKFDCLFAPS